MSESRGRGHCPSSGAVGASDSRFDAGGWSDARRYLKMRSDDGGLLTNDSSYH
jgi:hypothetical protein